jgi:magnesium chelatase subunit I
VLDRVRYDEDAPGLLADARADMQALSDKISAAQKALPDVKLSRNLKVKIATVCSNLGIDGLRGDLVINRTSRALVAFEGRQEVSSHQCLRSARLRRCLLRRGLIRADCYAIFACR